MTTAIGWLGVAHPVVLQQFQPEHEGMALRVRILRQRRLVGGRHHLDHAGMGLGGCGIEKATRPRAMLLTASTA